MHNPHDPYDPLSKLGQTTWGSSIRESQRLNERLKAQNRDAADFIAKQNRGSTARRAPLRSLTPEERAERDRRERNRRAIMRKPSLAKRLSGKVLSYLDADGALRVGADGDLGELELLDSKTHLARLQTAYHRVWETALNTSSAQVEHDQEAFLLHRDATERLKLMQRGWYITPVNRDAVAFESNRQRRKRALFGTKVVRNPLWRVRIADYDRRLRKFLDRSYGGAPWAGHLLNDIPLASHRAMALYGCFLRLPRTITV